MAIRDWIHDRETMLRLAFTTNVEAKLADPDDLADLDNFLAPGVSFDPRSAWDNVKARIVDRI